ncbi:hypothetical protein D9M68_765210 [compost metagenome]
MPYKGAGPALNDLIGAFKDSITEALGMGREVDNLGRNNSIREFADNAAIFLANVIDIARRTATVFQFLGESIGATAAIAAAANRNSIEGAKACGMNYRQRLRYVVLPQAFANTLPPLLGQTAVLIKDTSLLSLITVFELVAAGVQMNSDRIVPNESFLTIAAGYLLIYGCMLLLSRGVSHWLAGPAWNAR